MKRTVLGALAMFILLACLTSCVPTVSPDEYNALEQEYTALEQEHTALKRELDDAQHEINKLTEDLAAVKAGYADLLKGTGQSILKNPSWAELRNFLKLDDTDTLTYDKSNFDCDGFAITLRDHAWSYGLRCAYVQIEFTGEFIGHSLNAFQTTDIGVVYVDDGEHDTIAYVQTGKPYGVIEVDQVELEHIVCEGEPAAFWSPLQRTTHPNPFSYDYYESYQRRAEFLGQTIDAYNEAVDKFNKGLGDYSFSQLTNWSENIEALRA